MSSEEARAAIIYTHSLIEGSMTFIKSQAEALRSFRAVYAGAHRIDGIALPEHRTRVINDGSWSGSIKEAMFRRLGYARPLAKALRPFRPAIVHAHFGTCGPAAMSLAGSLRSPFLVTFHGHDATTNLAEARRTHRGRELLRKKDEMIDRAGCFIAVSSHIRNKLLQQEYPDSKIILHRNGIDLDFFRPLDETPRQQQIVFVGRFVEKKGVEYLVEAGARLAARGTKFELVMIGSGPLEAELRKAIDRAGIPVRFTGFLPTEEVRNWLGRAAVVAVPSVTARNGDSEGLPTTLLEAQAMETPVVATRHSGIPEGVLEGVTAELVEERDVTGLSEKLEGFLQAPERARAFGKAGRRFVMENFDMQAQCIGLEQIYEDLIKRHSSNH